MIQTKIETHEDLVALDHQYTMQTYGRYDVDIDHGKGATLWDLAGRRTSTLPPASG